MGMGVGWTQGSMHGVGVGLEVKVLGIFFFFFLKKWGYTGFTMSFRHSVLPLFRQNFISTQYLENQLTKFCMYVNIDKIVDRHFSQNFDRVTALD